MAQQLIQTVYCVEPNVNFTDKAKGLGLVQFSCHYSAFKMVGVKERIALIKAISHGYQRRKMVSESLQMYVAQRWRRMILLLSLTGLLLFSLNQNIAMDTVDLRSCRHLPRNSNGWWEMVWNPCTDERFKKTFRISKNTFNFILSGIQSDLESQTINEDSITPECRLAICIYQLGRDDYYYTIMEMPGLGASTVHEIATQCLPRGAACKEYHNFKNFSSMVLMAMVDSR